MASRDDEARVAACDPRTCTNDTCAKYGCVQKLNERPADNAALVLPLTRADAQALYDHVGTMPYLRGSWMHNLRDSLSQLLATGYVTRWPDGECRTCGAYTKPCPCEAMP